MQRMIDAQLMIRTGRPLKGNITNRCNVYKKLVAFIEKHGIIVQGGNMQIIGIRNDPARAYPTMAQAALETGISQRKIRELIADGTAWKGWSFDLPIDGVEYPGLTV